VTDAQLVALLGDGLMLVLAVAAPALIAAVAAGLVMGLLQGATQVQDSSLSFVPKLVAVVVAIVVTAGFAREQLVGFARDVLRACG